MAGPLDWIENLLGYGSVNRPEPDPRVQALEEMMIEKPETPWRQEQGGTGIPPWSRSGRAYPTRYQQHLLERMRREGQLTGRDALDAYNLSDPPEYGDPSYPHEDDIYGY